MSRRTFTFLIVDASEASEVSIYLVNGQSAPAHMKRQLDRSGKRTFINIHNDGPESLDGLVDEDSEQADERAEEVWEWIHENMVTENDFNPTDDRVVITHTISIAAV